MRYLTLLAVAGLAASFARAAAQTPAQPAQHDQNELSKQTQNPIGDLVSVPLQYNFMTGAALSGHTNYNLNLQPVMPLKLGKEWKIIVRPIVPFLNLGRPDGYRWRGIGDINLETFFVPPKPTSVTIGFGPLLSFPTATTQGAYSGAWGAGPAFVVVRTTGPWVISGLATQLWSFAGDDGHRELNQLMLQPAINFNLDDGWAIVTAPQITSDFTIDDGTRWTLPLGLGVTKVTAIGTQHMSVGIQYYNNVIRPHTSGSSLLRLVASFLFPNPPAKSKH